MLPACIAPNTGTGMYIPYVDVGTDVVGIYSTNSHTEILRGKTPEVDKRKVVFLHVHALTNDVKTVEASVGRCAKHNRRVWNTDSTIQPTLSFIIFTPLHHYIIL